MFMYVLCPCAYVTQKLVHKYMYLILYRDKCMYITPLIYM